MQKIILIVLLAVHSFAFADCESSVGIEPAQKSYWSAIKFLKSAKKDPFTIIGGAAIENGGVIKLKIVPYWVNAILKNSPPSMVMVADPDVTEDVLKNSGKFERLYKMIGTDSLGVDSFFLKDDSIPEEKEHWLVAHKALVGGFTPRFIEDNYVPIMREELQRLENSWVSRMGSDGILENAEKEINSFSIRVGFRAFMDRDLTDEEAEGLGPIFDRVLNKELSHTVREQIVPKIDQAIAARPGDPETELILDRLLAAQRKNNLPLSWVHDQMITLLFASQETTRFALVMGLYELSRQPEWQQKLEIKENSVAFVKEVLRFYTPVPAFPRRLREDGVFGGYQLYKGDLIQIITHAQHRNPKAWGDDAKEFKPERWLRDPGPEKNALCAFGGGMRMCIGAFMATLEMRMLFEHVISKWTIDPVTEKPKVGIGGGVLLVKSAVRLRLTPRK